MKGILTPEKKKELKAHIGSEECFKDLKTTRDEESNEGESDVSKKSKIVHKTLKKNRKAPEDIKYSPDFEDEIKNNNSDIVVFFIALHLFSLKV